MVWTDVLSSQFFLLSSHLFKQRHFWGSDMPSSTKANSEIHSSFFFALDLGTLKANICNIGPYPRWDRLLKNNHLWPYIFICKLIISPNSNRVHHIYEKREMKKLLTVAVMLQGYFPEVDKKQYNIYVNVHFYKVHSGASKVLRIKSSSPEYEFMGEAIWSPEMESYKLKVHRVSQQTKSLCSHYPSVLSATPLCFSNLRTCTFKLQLRVPS